MKKMYIKNVDFNEITHFSVNAQDSMSEKSRMVIRVLKMHTDYFCECADNYEYIVCDKNGKKVATLFSYYNENKVVLAWENGLGKAIETNFNDNLKFDYIPESHIKPRRESVKGQRRKKIA